MTDLFSRYKNIIVADFEFFGEQGLPIPVCCTAKNLSTGEVWKEWLLGEFGPLKEPPLLKYPIDKNTLFIAYYSIAEMSCHITLKQPIPPYILDLFTEFRCNTNGIHVPSGNSLIGACQFFGIKGTDILKKEIWRKRILQGPPFNDIEKIGILDYCFSDVLMTEQLFNKMKETIDLDYALIRGRYMGSVAQVEHNGIPIDTEKLQELMDCWDIIKEELIWRVDQKYHVYEGTTFKINLFKNLLERLQIPWDYTTGGLPKTDSKYFSERVKAHPELRDLAELRYSLNQLKLKDITICSDGRNRYMTSPLRSKTGRNQPSSSNCIFGNATWIRHLIKPNEGRAISYVDYEQEEIAIAGVLSEDKNLINDYETGDVYLNFCKSIGAVPETATKESHKETRDKFKQLFLAIGYGQSEESFSKDTGIPLIEVKYIFKQHREKYKKYWDWNENFCDAAKFNGEISTSFHWKFKTWFVDRQNTLKNWSMQSHGSDILRIAVILCTQNGIKVCGMVHDALLVEDSIENIDRTVALTQKLMGDASQYVIGYRIRTDAKTIRYPDRFTEKRGKTMWDTVWNIIDTLSPEEKTHRVREKQGNLLDFEPKTPKVKHLEGTSNRRKSQLLLKPQNITEKNLAERIRKLSGFSHVEVMALIRLARDTDFDLEMEFDWKNISYEEAKKKLLLRIGKPYAN